MSSLTKSIEGTVLLKGHTDHSGTAVGLVDTSVPTLHFGPMLFLCLLLSMLLLSRREKFFPVISSLCIVITGVLLVPLLAHALLSLITPQSGYFELTRADGMAFKPGVYSILLEHPGYHSRIMAVEVLKQGEPVLKLPEVVLQPRPYSAGDLVIVDGIMGPLRFVPETGPQGFVQGSPPDEICRYPSEDQFIHILTRDILVMETETTRTMWQDLHALHPDILPPDPTDPAYGSGMNHPVQNITWFDAVLFCNVLSLHKGLRPCYYTNSSLDTVIDLSNFEYGTYFCDFDANGFRLPTEGEWEYFSRAGTTDPFYTEVTGMNLGNCRSCDPGIFPALEEIAVMCGNSPGVSAPVGTKKANPWNLKDVIGNVWEWCYDGGDTYPVGTVVDYHGSRYTLYRIYRGTSWWDGRPVFCRSAFRVALPAYYRPKNMGIRLVRNR